MKLTSFKYFSHTLRFKDKFSNSREKFNERKVFILECKDSDGNKFFGEAAPLPNYSTETFVEVENELKKIDSIFPMKIGFKFENILDQIKNISLMPSVQYAMEQIFLSAYFKRNFELSHFPVLANNINVNGLLGIEDIESSKAKIQKFIEDGFGTIKLKVGKENIDQLLTFLEWTEYNYNNSLKFRIDPNGAWTKDETSSHCNLLKSFPIEYIEQPVQDKYDLCDLSYNCSIPLAADESFRSLKDAKELMNNSDLKFLIVKPMLFGGFSQILELQKLVEGTNIKIIISSSFESNIGRRHLVLCSGLVNNNLAHGLSTSELFTNQPVDDSFPVSRGKVHFSIDKYISEIEINS